MRIGVDLGGTKTEAVVLDDAGQQRFVGRVRTPAEGGYEAILDTVCDLVGEAERAAGATEGRATVGIGTPGALVPGTDVLRNANTTCLNGRPLLADLQQRLGPRVRIANDANCFALSEASDGAGAGADVVFGVILGTGVGGGLVVHQRVLTGPNALAGEWGHNPLPWPDADDAPPTECYCGHRGCIETWLSGPGMATRYRAAHGGQASAAQIVLLAQDGIQTAVAALDRYVDRLARALAMVINVVDPDVVVLGGGLSNIERLYRDVPQRWSRYAMAQAPLRTRLVAARHGDSSGVRGAAWLWPRRD